MSEKYDAFGDVRNQTDGTFGAEQAALQPGLKKLQTVAYQPTEEGIMLQFHCQVCGQTTLLTAEYPEIVALKYGVNPVLAYQNYPNMLQSPTRWEFVPRVNGWTPDMKCSGGCGASVDLLVEPHEPERYLQAARRRGFINEAGEAQVSAICAKFRQGGQGVRR